MRQAIVEVGTDDVLTERKLVVADLEALKEYFGADENQPPDVPIDTELARRIAVHANQMWLVGEIWELAVGVDMTPYCLKDIPSRTLAVTQDKLLTQDKMPTYDRRYFNYTPVNVMGLEGQEVTIYYISPKEKVVLQQKIRRGGSKDNGQGRHSG